MKEKSRVSAVLVVGLLPAICLLSSPAIAYDSKDRIFTPGRAVELREGSFPNDLQRGGLLIVQFRGELSDYQLQVLESYGIEVSGYLEGNAYWVKAQPGAELKSLPFVRSAARALPEDKITPPLAFVAQAGGADTLQVTVSFFESCSGDEAFNLLAGLNALPAGDKMLYGQRIVAEVPRDSLRELAASELVSSIEPAPGEKVTYNIKAARTSSVDDARKEWNLTGAGVSGGVWDEGPADAHPDFADRLTVAEKADVSDHATHVTGTIAGSGRGRRPAMGMAPECEIFSYTFKGDVPSEMAAAVKSNKISFANNSWGYANGWAYHSVLKLWIWFGDYNFGHYNSESAAYDDLIYKSDLVVLFAAGNDRNDSGTTEKYLDVTIGRASEVPHPGDGPYRTIGVTGAAKNVITVGAVDKRGRMTSFSSWGPTKDGRVKPEVVADGQAVLSTIPDGKYASYSGTSMATPVVSGAVALLVEQYRESLKREPGVAEIRALIAATSKDLGNKGPDYSFGFGLLDLEGVTGLIDDCKICNPIITDTVSKGGANRVKRYKLQLKGGARHLKIALAWVDPAAQANAANTLVNDLDLRVYREADGEEFLPWTLDPENPSAPAEHGVNTADNIELVEIENPSAEGLVIEVSASRLAKGGKQNFALVLYPSEDVFSALLKIPNP